MSHVLAVLHKNTNNLKKFAIYLFLSFFLRNHFHPILSMPELSPLLFCILQCYMECFEHINIFVHSLVLLHPI